MINEKDQWLIVTRPLLSGIRTDAFWVKHHAKAILDKARLLPAKPGFATEAEAEIAAALQDVSEAGAYLVEVMRVYDSKPVK